MEPYDQEDDKTNLKHKGIWLGLISYLLLVIVVAAIFIIK
jgi:hypothetical protein